MDEGDVGSVLVGIVVWMSGLRAAMIESCHRAASGDIVIVQLACAWKLKRFTTRTVDFQLIARSRVDGGAAKI